MMTKDEIKAAFDSFIDFQIIGNNKFVTTTSTLIFAEHVAGIVGTGIARLENELLAATLRIDNDAMRLAEMAAQLDIQAGSIEAVQAANVRLASERDALKAELEIRHEYSDMLAEIDRLKAELAALRNQEPVGSVTVSSWRGLENIEWQKQRDIPEGTHAIYLAPGARPVKAG